MELRLDSLPGLSVSLFIRELLPKELTFHTVVSKPVGQQGSGEDIFRHSAPLQSFPHINIDPTSLFRVLPCFQYPKGKVPVVATSSQSWSSF